VQTLVGEIVQVDEVDLELAQEPQQLNHGRNEQEGKCEETEYRVSATLPERHIEPQLDSGEPKLGDSALQPDRGSGMKKKSRMTARLKVLRKVVDDGNPPAAFVVPRDDQQRADLGKARPVRSHHREARVRFRVVFSTMALSRRMGFTTEGGSPIAARRPECLQNSARYEQRSARMCCLRSVERQSARSTRTAAASSIDGTCFVSC